VATNRKIVIEIHDDGSSSVDAQGFVGNSCSLATKEIEYALAGHDPGNRDDKKKPEFAMNPGSTATQRN
jgi:hypothetical protein